MLLDCDIVRPLCAVYSGQENWTPKLLQEARNEILWIFQNITFNDSRLQSRIIKRRGLANFVVSQLNVGDVELTTKSLIVLGNIASEGGDTRD